MRILLVGDYPRDPRLGSSKVLFKLQEELVSLGHSVHLLMADQIGPTWRRARVRQLVAPSLAAAAIRRAEREHGPFDVIDVASAEGFVYGAVFGRGRRRPAIVNRSNGLEHLNYRRMIDDHRHGIRSKSWIRRIWFPLVRLSQVAGAMRVADRAIVLNERDRDFVLRAGWMDPAAVEIIPHGISKRYLDESPSDDHARGAGILFCGSWTETKGTDYLIEAFGMLAATSDATLTILGPGVDEAEVRARFPDELQDRVRIIPRVSEEQVMHQYRIHDVLVFCSTYEGFGMVVVEAMSQGLPVVATTVGCAPTFIEDRRTGVLVEPRDAAALGAGLSWMLEDAGRRREIGRAARQRVANATWTETARRTVRLYEEARRDLAGGHA